MTAHDKVMLAIGVAYFIADSLWKIATEEKIRRLEERENLPRNSPQ